MTDPERPPYLVTSLDEIEEVPAVGGTLRWKPVRRTLDVRAFGINAYAADAGQDVVEAHDESGSGAGGHEELYLVVRGRARFTLDGEEHDAPAGTLVFAGEPRVRRSAHAVQDGTLVLAIGADPSGRYRVSPWEHWFIAEARSGAGDHDAAIATMTAAREEQTGNPAYHFNFACFLARAGRLDEAVAELARALEAAPETVQEWARGDADLDPLRDRPDWPLPTPAADRPAP
jgi:tetratricopeptide (TPR) repeat protein